MSEVWVPGDKSLSQRALIFATLAEGTSRIRGLLYGGDTASTAGALRALGSEIAPLPHDGSEMRIEGLGLAGLRTPKGRLDLGNSGTGTRLLLGVLAGSSVTATLDGDASLRGRPMARVTTPLAVMGARFEYEDREDRLPIVVHGRRPLEPLDWESPVASAQVKSALLLAGLTGRAFVMVTEPRQSRDHTERLLNRAGVRVIAHPGERGWRVEMRDPPDRIAPLDFDVPGDISSAAFVLGFAALGGAHGPVTARDVGLNPTRTAVLDVLERMGARVEIERRRTDEHEEPVGDVTVHPSALTGTDVGDAEIPRLIDELPIIAALAARAKGETRITGAAELRAKESDRITALVANFRSLGVEVEELPDGLAVRGSDRPLRGRVRGFEDHRIVMAFSVLGELPENDIELASRRAADVSFPGFAELLYGLSAGRVPRGARRPAARAAIDDRRPGGRGLVVTLDGPAGSGKSTTAKAVARELGFRHLDSGSLYRALTHALLDRGIPPDRWPELLEEDLQALGVSVDPEAREFRVLVAGQPVDAELRSPQVTQHVSHLASLPAARACLLELQRAAGRSGSLVADGRDMGTVVFPDADVKVFLVAELEERARRRLREVGMEHPTGHEVASEAVALHERDKRDSEREISPLKKPPGALEIDTTRLSFSEQVEAIVRLARAVDDARGPV